MADKTTTIIDIQVSYKEAFENIEKINRELDSLIDYQKKLRKEQQENGGDRDKYNKDMATTKILIDENKAALKLYINEVKNNRKEEQARIGSVERYQAQLARLRAEYKKLGDVEEKDIARKKEIAKEIATVDRAYQAANKDLKQYYTQVGNYEDAIKNAFGLNNSFANSILNLSKDTKTGETSLKSFFSNAGTSATAFGKTLLGLLTNPVFLAIAGIAGAGIVFKFWYDYNKGLVEANKLTKEFTGLAGDDLKVFRNQIQAVADTFDKDYKEVLTEANDLAVKQGISQQDALEKIKQKYIKDAGVLGGIYEKQMKANEDLNNAVSALFDMTEGGFEGLIGQAKIFATESLTTIVKGLIDVTNWFIRLYNNSELFREQIQGVIATVKTLFSILKYGVKLVITDFKILGDIIEGALTGDFTKIKQGWTDFNKSLKEGWSGLKDELSGIADDYLDAINNPKMLQEISIQETVTTTTKGKKTGDDNKKVQTEQDKLNEEMRKLEIIHQEKLLKIKQDYANGTIKTEAEYNRELFAQEQAFNLLKLQALDDYKTTDEKINQEIRKQKATIQQKQLDDQIKFNQQFEKALAESNPLEKERQDYKNRLIELKLFDVDRTKLTAEQLQVLEHLEKEHQENLTNLTEQGVNKRVKELTKANKSQKDLEDKNIKEAEDRINTLSSIGALQGNQLFEEQFNLQQQRIQQTKDWLQALTDAGITTGEAFNEANNQLYEQQVNLTNLLGSEFTRRKDQLSQYAESFGSIMGNVISGQKDAFSAFTDFIIDQTFSALTSMINAKLTSLAATGLKTTGEAAMESFATSDSVLTFGATGAAVIAALIAGALTAAKAGLKGLLKSGKKNSYATGGLVSGYGSGTSDSISANLSNGESVLTARSTAMFAPVLSAFNQLGGGVPISTTNVSSQVMGEDMLARAVAKGVAMLPNPVVSVQEINNVNDRVSVLENDANP